MYRVLDLRELRELSLAELKTEYDKLTKVYARRMYEMQKKHGEVFEALYGERKTASELAKDFLDADMAERSRYMMAYQSLAEKYQGQAAFTEKQVQAKIKFAQQSFPGQNILRAIKNTYREGKQAQRLQAKLTEKGFNANVFDMNMSDLIKLYMSVDPYVDASVLAKEEKTNYASEGDFYEALLDRIEQKLDEDY